MKMKLVQRENGYLKSFIFINSQREYDYAMKQLEDEGFAWLSGHKPTEKQYFDISNNNGKELVLGIVVYYKLNKISFIKRPKESIRAHVEELKTDPLNPLLVCNFILNASYEEIS